MDFIQKGAGTGQTPPRRETYLDLFSNGSCPGLQVADSWLLPTLTNLYGLLQLKALDWLDKDLTPGKWHIDHPCSIIESEDNSALALHSPSNQPLHIDCGDYLFEPCQYMAIFDREVDYGPLVGEEKLLGTPYLVLHFLGWLGTLDCRQGPGPVDFKDWEGQVVLPPFRDSTPV